MWALSLDHGCIELLIPMQSKDEYDMAGLLLVLHSLLHFHDDGGDDDEAIVIRNVLNPNYTSLSV